MLISCICTLACMHTYLPNDPGIDDDALREVAVLVEDHMTLGSAPHPVPPPGQEPVARAVRHAMGQHCRETRRGDRGRGGEGRGRRGRGRGGRGRRRGGEGKGRGGRRGGKGRRGQGRRRGWGKTKKMGEERERRCSIKRM